MFEKRLGYCRVWHHFLPNCIFSISDGVIVTNAIMTSPYLTWLEKANQTNLFDTHDALTWQKFTYEANVLASHLTIFLMHTD